MNEREKIVMDYLAQGRSLSKIAKEHNCSRAMVSRIKKSAEGKARFAALVAEFGLKPNQV